MRVSCSQVGVVLVVLLSLSSPRLIRVSTVKREFSLTYQLKEPSSQNSHELEIKCCSFQVLSIRLRESNESNEQPRYRIFLDGDDNGLNLNSYTYMEHCHADIEVNDA